uniref:Uncharacterized protein n=1 Tax=Setaria italica TaxID=4555 RepID=K4A4H6_SETIT
MAAWQGIGLLLAIEPRSSSFTSRSNRITRYRLPARRDKRPVV